MFENLDNLGILVKQKKILLNIKYALYIWDNWKQKNIYNWEEENIKIRGRLSNDQ